MLLLFPLYMRKLNYREIKYLGGQEYIYTTKGRCTATVLHNFTQYYSLSYFCPFTYTILHSHTYIFTTIVFCFFSFIIIAGFPSLKLTVNMFFLFPPHLQVHVCSVMSDSLQPHELLSLWDFPDKNTGVGCRFLLHPISVFCCYCWLFVSFNHRHRGLT